MKVYFALAAASWVALQPASAFGAEPLTLVEAQRRAVERSRQLDAQDASIIASREMAFAAGRLPDPVVRAGVDNLPVDGGDKFNVTRDFMTMRRIGVMQEFTRSEKRDLQRERFEREADKTAAEKEATIAAIQRDAAIAWLDRYYLEAMVAVASDQVRASQAEVESADSAYRAGRGAQADVFAARTALAAARDRAADLQRRARAAAIDLARWIGDAAGLALGTPPDSGAVRLREESLETHLGTHPEFVVLDREAGVAESQARLASAARHPDWTWEATFQQRGPAYSNMISIGVSMPLPWDTANRQDREVAAKLAMVDEIHARRDEMLRAHVAEVSAMLEEWKAGRQRRATYWTEILELSRERTEATLAAYRGGKSSLNDVLAARRGESDMRLQALQLDLDVARLWARLNFLLPDADALPAGAQAHSHEGKPQ